MSDSTTIQSEILALETLTGYPAYQDRYVGSEERYIVFTYEDESPAAYGSNRPIADTTQIQISMFGPESWNYFADKTKVRDYLENLEYSVSSRAYLEDIWHEATQTLGPEKIRRVLFIAKKTIGRS